MRWTTVRKLLKLYEGKFTGTSTYYAALMALGEDYTSVLVLTDSLPFSDLSLIKEWIQKNVKSCNWKRHQSLIFFKREEDVMKLQIMFGHLEVKRNDL